MVRIEFRHGVAIGGRERLGLLLPHHQIDLSGTTVVILYIGDSIMHVPWSNVKYVEQPNGFQHAEAQEPEPKKPKGKKGAA